MGRNFANKIWNASRFVMMNLEDFDINTFEEKEVKYELVDEWILSRLQETAKAVETRLSHFQLDEAAKAVYEFLRGDFCDWYVEIAKIRLYNLEDVQSKRTAQYVLWSMLEAGLRLLHPFMPYISEEIWQSIKRKMREKRLFLQNIRSLKRKISSRLGRRFCLYPRSRFLFTKYSSGNGNFSGKGSKSNHSERR